MELFQIQFMLQLLCSQEVFAKIKEIGFVLIVVIRDTKLTNVGGSSGYLMMFEVNGTLMKMLPLLEIFPYMIFIPKILRYNTDLNQCYQINKSSNS